MMQKFALIGAITIEQREKRFFFFFSMCPIFSGWLNLLASRKQFILLENSLHRQLWAVVINKTLVKRITTQHCKTQTINNNK